MSTNDQFQEQCLHICTIAYFQVFGSNTLRPTHPTPTPGHINLNWCSPNAKWGGGDCKGRCPSNLAFLHSWWNMACCQSSVMSKVALRTANEANGDYAIASWDGCGITWPLLNACWSCLLFALKVNCDLHTVAVHVRCEMVHCVLIVSECLVWKCLFVHMYRAKTYIVRTFKGAHTCEYYI